MKSLSELIELLTLEKINDHTFIGKNYKAPWGRVFGGQVLAHYGKTIITAAFPRFTP